MSWREKLKEAVSQNGGLTRQSTVYGIKRSTLGDVLSGETKLLGAMSPKNQEKLRKLAQDFNVEIPAEEFERTFKVQVRPRPKRQKVPSPISSKPERSSNLLIQKIDGLLAILELPQILREARETIQTLTPDDPVEEFAGMIRRLDNISQYLLFASPQERERARKLVGDPREVIMILEKVKHCIGQEGNVRAFVEANRLRERRSQ